MILLLPYNFLQENRYKEWIKKTEGEKETIGSASNLLERIKLDIMSIEEYMYINFLVCDGNKKCLAANEWSEK